LPVFHEKEVLFVHIPKTAGMSIEHALGMRLRWPQLDRKVIFGPCKGHQLQHLTCRQIIEYGFLDSIRFRRYYKFSFVRNPYDRLVSEYIFDKKWNEKTKNMELKEFLNYLSEQLDSEIIKAHYRPQVDFIFDDNNDLIVNFVGRFESLIYDWGKVMNKSNADLPELPHINKGDRLHYMEYFDADTIAMANKLYAVDFKKLGYLML